MVLSNFTTLCWATFIATLGRMQPAGRGLDTPGREGTAGKSEAQIVIIWAPRWFRQEETAASAGTLAMQVVLGCQRKSRSRA